MQVFPDSKDGSFNAPILVDILTICDMLILEHKIRYQPKITAQMTT